MVWNSHQKDWQPIAKNLSNQDIKVIQRAWNDWLWVDVGVESSCPWKSSNDEYIEGIKTDLTIGTCVEDIIKQLKKLPKSAILNKAVVLLFENYK